MKKRLYSKFFLSVFSRIQTEYRQILRISQYSLRMRENTDHKNSECGYFLRSVKHLLYKNFRAPGTRGLNNIPINNSDWYFMKTFFVYILLLFLFVNKLQVPSFAKEWQSQGAVTLWLFKYSIVGGLNTNVSKRELLLHIVRFYLGGHITS